MDPDTSNRVDDLWFLLEIRAGRKIFRVTKSVLAARSSVFRDMVPWNVGGISVVILQDPAADVEVFLRAIFDSSYFMPAPEPIEIGVVLGILRLSDKYDVQYLYRRALGHLERGYYFSSVAAFRDSGPDRLIYPADNAVLRHRLALIKTATEVGALWLLPAAYYWATPFEYDELVAATPSGTARDVQKCIRAGLTLSRAHVNSIRFFTTNLIEGCTDASGCNEFRLHALDMYFNQVTDSQGLDLDPLRNWPAPVWDLISQGHMCGPCVQSCKDTHASNLHWSYGPVFRACLIFLTGRSSPR
ncbi:hypothetical protein FB451DRAFT_758193 [Mycena latifolia]|nr:hypothetical protein FB451DRAFT_758193 [Mycena latifolia]